MYRRIRNIAGCVVDLCVMLLALLVVWHTYKASFGVQRVSQPVPEINVDMGRGSFGSDTGDWPGWKQVKPSRSPSYKKGEDRRC